MKLKKLILSGGIATVLCMASGGCGGAGSNDQKSLPAGAVLIDVRSAEEFNTGHLAGAVNIPHTEIAEKISGVAKDKSTPLYLYCRSGRRVGIAMEELSKLGYTKMVNLGGAEEASQKLNRPLVTE